MRLFYRLIGTLRQRTLDCIECIVAWRRKTKATEPFIYYGKDYMANIGPDLKFLDDRAFLSDRMMNQKASEDPFLVEITADGVPIEEVSDMDIRRGEESAARAEVLGWAGVYGGGTLRGQQEEACWGGASAFLG